MLESHNKGQNKNTNERKQMDPTYGVQSVNVNKAVFYV